MTYLEQLLDGAEVEWRPLNEVFEIRTGYTPSKKNSAFWDGGTIPWFRMEDLRTHGGLLSDAIQHITPQAIKSNELFKAGSIILATSATIGEHALLLTDALANQRFTNFNLQGAFADRVLPKFAYYYFFKIDAWCKEHVFTGTFPSVDMKNLRKQLFPLPPLAVQERIVEILDKFTALEAELEAELEARKKQYEYYRNRLLRFGANDPNVQWCRLGDIGTFVRGNGLQKKDFTETGVPCIHYGQIYTYYGMFATETKSFVSEEAALKFRKAQQGDLIIATTSENVRDLCKTVVWLGKEEICISAHSAVFHHHQNPKYLAFYFQTPWFLRQKEWLAKGTTVMDISVKDLMKIEIPVPPLAVQEQIVAILDKFHTLVHSISEGLPAEIALRRRQYEYYRNLLLRFPFP